jgi:hypothetical protein
VIAYHATILLTTTFEAYQYTKHSKILCDFSIFYYAIFTWRCKTVLPVKQRMPLKWFSGEKRLAAIQQAVPV